MEDDHDLELEEPEEPLVEELELDLRLVGFPSKRHHVSREWPK